MRIAVYAICKNESQFVDRWMDSMSEADQVVVLDTGSTDDTVERLKKRGAQVTVELISPWRFDVARNRSLDLVSEDTDICVCTDLDEVFHPGWRATLERAWQPGAGQATYRYTWSFNPDGSEGVVFWYEKAHARYGYQWIHPVHHPDPTKSRGQYLPLLELSVEEEPEDDRNTHYLGREYMYRGRWDDCIRTLEHHLSMPTATWKDERAASMRYIALSWLRKGDRARARDWYLRAIAEAPHLREPYMDLARMLYDMEEWDGVLYFTGCALSITIRPKTYICEADSWGSLPHDLRCQALFQTGRRALALDEARAALACAPSDPRLRGNVAVLEQLLGETERSAPYGADLSPLPGAVILGHSPSQGAGGRPLSPRSWRWGRPAQSAGRGNGGPGRAPEQSGGRPRRCAGCIGPVPGQI